MTYPGVHNRLVTLPSGCQAPSLGQTGDHAALSAAAPINTSARSGPARSPLRAITT